MIRHPGDMTRPPERTEHKWRTQDSFTPSYRAFHEVYPTKGFRRERDLSISRKHRRIFGEACGRFGMTGTLLSAAVLLSKFPLRVIGEQHTPESYSPGGKL